MADTFAADVEAARLGVVFAHDTKAYQRWRRRSSGAARRSRALDDQALEAAIMGLASRHPEYVMVGTR